MSTETNANFTIGVPAESRPGETRVAATPESVKKLAKKIAELAPGRLSRTMFVSGGSEAVETAIKMAKQYHVNAGRKPRAIQQDLRPQNPGPRCARLNRFGRGLFGGLGTDLCSGLAVWLLPRDGMYRSGSG